MTHPRLIVIGTSLGGMDALRVLFGMLPANLPAALAIVIHRNKVETGHLLPMLNRLCKLPVTFPSDKEIIKQGCVYIAPPDYHLLIEDGHFAFSVDEQVNNARPSIDVLFESAADAGGADVTGIVLTGMGHDGARGLAAIKRCGGSALVQSPGEAAASSMPLAVLAAVPGVRVCTLEEMGAWFSRMTSPVAIKDLQ
ncbi:MAG TPA: chemotaxis protein CheB [Acidobacteriaceae bacterium]|nr:chemotaxis protein CheB [Acidobacteriaceae bacterium]